MPDMQTIVHHISNLIQASNQTNCHNECMLVMYISASHRYVFSCCNFASEHSILLLCFNNVVLMVQLGLGTKNTVWSQNTWFCHTAGKCPDILYKRSRGFIITELKHSLEQWTLARQPSCGAATTTSRRESQLIYMQCERETTCFLEMSIKDV